MIEFATLLLGLVAGPQVVELAADPAVAQVRLLVDGEPAASDSAPPWKLEIDLGESLRPRRLEAVALDATGGEIGRARQLLNVPVAPAVVRMTLERGDGGGVEAALLTWESTVGRYPLAHRAWLDGAPLAVADPSRIALPAHDPETAHLFEVELEFTPDVIARGQAFFGGRFLDQIRTDLTAVPVVPRGRAKRLDGSDASGWLTTAHGEAPRVIAFETGGLDLVLVRGPGVDEALESLEGTISRQLSAGGMASGASAPGAEGTGASGLATIGNIGVASQIERLQRVMALDKDQRLRILAPRARSRAGRTVRMEVFALSPQITPDQGGLYWALGQRIDLPGLAPELRLADAVAVAGLQAANGRGRRAVLLVLSADPETDASRHSASSVRDYLRSIQVPLVVWRMGEGAESARREWGEGESIADFRQLQTAARRLSDALARQRIVWLEGDHLPTDLATAPQSPVELAR